MPADATADAIAHVTGDFQEVWMGRTIIRSRHKLTYQQAQNLVDGVSVEPNIGGDEAGRAALKLNLQTLCDFADHLRQGRLEVSRSCGTSVLVLCLLLL